MFKINISSQRKKDIFDAIVGMILLGLTAYLMGIDSPVGMAINGLYFVFFIARPRLGKL